MFQQVWHHPGGPGIVIVGEDAGMTPSTADLIDALGSRWLEGGLRRDRERPGKVAAPVPAAGQIGPIPQWWTARSPGASRMRSSPVRKAFGGQLIGSTASPRRRCSFGRVSPV